MNGMPRLIADVRRKSIQRQLFAIALLAGCIYGAWCGFELYSENLKAEAKAVVSEIDFERNLLSGGVVMDLRRSSGDVVSRAKHELKEIHYVFPGDPEAFAVTRDDERCARECVAIYCTNTYLRCEIEDEINKDIMEFSKTNESMLNAVSNSISNDMSASDSAFSELLEARSALGKVDGRKIVLPWLHYRAVDAAHSALEHLKKSSFHVGLMNDIDDISRGVESFSRRVESKMAEMRVYDDNARMAADKLLSMQFGRGRIEAAYKSKLEAAKDSLAEECISASNIVDEVFSTFVAAVDIDRNIIDLAECEAKILYDLHGSEFVNVGTIRICRQKFIQACVVATNVANKSKSKFIDAIKERDRIGDDLDEMIARISNSIFMADEKTVMSICGDADALVERISLDADVAAVTNTISVEMVKLGGIAKDAEDRLNGIKNELPKWSKLANDINNELKELTNIVTSGQAMLREKIHDLSNMSGDLCESFKQSAKDILKRADELLRGRPEFHCSNGKEATDAKKAAEEYKRAVEDLDKSVSKFCSGLESAVNNKEISRINYETSYFNNLLRQFEFGETTFDFYLDFVDSGEKTIEISVSKEKGQLFKPNKMAQSIRLIGEVMDLTYAKSGSGELYFGNTVKEREHTLLSLQTVGDVGYRSFRLKLRLVCGSKELSGSTYSSDWNAELLQFKLKVDGEDIYSVWTKE